MTKDEELEQLRQENSALRDQVTLLSERISELEAQLAKDSHNSHLPPSSDRFHRQPKSLRKKSGKQPGGQTGHAGNTLKLSETPDLVIVHPVDSLPALSARSARGGEPGRGTAPGDRSATQACAGDRTSGPAEMLPCAVNRSAPLLSLTTCERQCSMEQPLGQWESTWCSSNWCPMSAPVK